MKVPRIQNKNLSLALLLAVVLGGASTFAYTNPQSAFPVNTYPPIDEGVTNQVKLGGLSVNEFQTRSDADLQQNATFVGPIQAGNPGQQNTVVQVGTNTLVSGEIRAAQYLNSSTLQHNASQPKPLCGDGAGNIIFC